MEQLFSVSRTEYLPYRHDPSFLRYVKPIPHAFVNIIAVKDNEIDYDILNRSAKLIKNVSTLSNSGYDNFRLGISNNIQPNCPFFPFTYSSGDYSFSIALELTQEINDILNANKARNDYEAFNKFNFLEFFRRKDILSC